MKTVQIYKTKKEFIIVTEYQLMSKAYISSDPIFKIPLSIADYEFEEFIFIALNSSKTLTESEESKYWLGKEYMKKIGAKSYENFYKNTNSCTLEVENNLMTIYPMKYQGKNRGIHYEGSKFEINLENNEENIVVKIIKQVLEIDYKIQLNDIE
jgi:hypothetical protein